jgi:hypothetical protein
VIKHILRLGGAGLVGGLAFLCFLPSAFAQPASMDLTGVNGNSYDGVYTSPYYATVNGVATTVICDDFETESYIGETWSANVTNVASVVAGTSTAKFSPAQDYDAVANLATQLLSIPASSEQAVILSFAIWDIFDRSGVQAWLANPSNGGDPLGVSALALADANAALSASYTPGEYANVVIYSSTTGTPQEFVSVTAPEASTPVLMAVDLLGFIALVGFLRKRVVRIV